MLGIVLRCKSLGRLGVPSECAGLGRPARRITHSLRVF